MGEREGRERERERERERAKTLNFICLSHIYLSYKQLYLMLKDKFFK